MIGELSPEAARDFGLKAGVRVAAGCGDTAAGALGRRGCESRNAAGYRRNGLRPRLLHRPVRRRHTSPGPDGHAFCHSRNLETRLAYVGGGGLALQWYGREFSNNHEGGDSPDEFYDELFVERQRSSCRMRRTPILTPPRWSHSFG